MRVFMWLGLVVFLFVNCANGVIPEHKNVETHNGIVRGYLKQTLIRNVSYYSYLGIPYAEKPINNFRFLAPVPIASWKPHIFDAIKYGNSCIQQANSIGTSGPVSEDCLYLNIFVPANLKPHKKLAVIFFIHGGGFAEGSGNDKFNGPDFLLEQNVILVTANYRLGTFGFMSLNTKLYSGNMGLKDQALALKWTHRNIQAFGGDRKQITLMGQSAGAVSVHYHVLIPQSRKLINRAICISGSAFLRYAYLDEKSHFKKMLAFAQKEGKSITKMNELVDYLKEVPTQRIVEETSQPAFNLTLIFDWAPQIERRSAAHPILTKTPDEIYNSNPNVNVDMMFGFTNYECLGLAWSVASNATQLNDFLDKFNLELPVHNLKPNFDSKSYRKLLDMVENHYFGNVTSDHDKSTQMINMISDLNMVTPIDRAIKTQAKHSKRSSYYYQFSIDGKLNYIKMQLNATWPGASHFDDICYLFRCHAIDSVYGDILKTKHHDEISKVSYDTIQLLSSMYANFAKYGRPSVGGKPVKGYQPIRNHKINFLDITNEALIPGVSPKKNEIKFWNRIIENAETLIR